MGEVVGSDNISYIDAVDDWSGVAVVHPVDMGQASVALCSYRVKTPLLHEHASWG